MAPSDGADPADPFGLIGTLLERKYRIDRAVAEGGYGVVYAGHHLSLDVAIAVKVLKPARDLDRDAWVDALDQFQREARTIAKLRHAGVVAVLDTGVARFVGFDVDIPWIVLEWLEGETLRDDLERRRGQGGRTPQQALALLRPVFEALAEAHEAGIAHRDLKPSNIMLVPKKGGVQARVLDFGIAKLMENERAEPTGQTTTAAQVRAFSVAYAAPEQLAGTRTGPWTDVHALGLLLTEVLTDASPYPPGDTASLYKSVFDATRPTPTTKRVEVGPWEGVLARALAIAPNDRYADAGELLRALEASSPVPLAVTARDGSTEKSVTVVPAPVPREGERTKRVSTTKVLRGAAALIVASIVVAGGFRLVTRARRPVETPAPSASTSSAPACTSNDACTQANDGHPAICRADRGCVPLESVDCSVYADARALSDEGTLWFGTMFPKTGEDWLEFGRPNHQAAELARRDFAQTMSGLTLEGDGVARPFGVVACDDAADPTRAARHLVDDVGVPAVIGFRSSVEAIELSNTIFVPRRVLAIVANNGNPLITTVPQPPDGPRMVWRTMVNNNEVARALSGFTEVLEAQVRKAGLGAAGTLRVSLLRPKNAAGAAFSDAVFRSLRFNGKSALDNGYDFRELTYDDSASDYGENVGDLLRFLPHVILYAGGPPVVREVLARLEDSWPKTSPQRPRYASVAMLTAEMLKFIGTSDERRRRIFGVTPASARPANARLVMHYNETFEDRITRTYAPNTIYDGFYLLAFSSFTLQPGEAPTGANLARGFAKLLPPGRRVEVGLTGIFEAYTALRGGQHVDLVGATGDMDFDLATGEAPFDYAILCAGLDVDGKVLDGIESGLVYSAATGKLTGTMKCP